MGTPRQIWAAHKGKIGEPTKGKSGSQIGLYRAL